MTIPKSYEALAADLASEKIISKTLLGQRETFMKLSDERRFELRECKSRESALREELAGANRRLGACINQIEEQQQRLTVAEQLLSETLPHLRFCKGMGQKFSEKLGGLDLRIESALKQSAEGEGS